MEYDPILRKQQQSREYYARHREELLEKKRTREAANREKIRAYNRAYYAANREKLCAYQREYAAKRKAEAALRLAEMPEELGEMREAE